MVTGFEKRTKPLTTIEVNTLVPYIVKRLAYNKGVENAVKARTIIEALNAKEFNYTDPKSKKLKVVKVTGPRFRQMIHYIRVQGLIKHLIATSNGYYVATKKEDLEKYIRSLIERRNSFEEVRAAMQRQLQLNPLKS